MATIDETMEVKLDQLLAVFAYNYMKQHQGDIIIDHRNIFKTLEKNGEIEVYLSKFHFDTENRFRFGDDEMPVEQARENARKQKWGEYIIKIKIDNHRLLLEIEMGRDDADTFPLDRMWMVDEITSYHCLSNFGKEITGTNYKEIF